jgi:hypothetical protein
MLLFRRVSPLGKLDDLTGIFLSLRRVSRNYLCRHAAHKVERDLVEHQRWEVDQIQTCLDEGGVGDEDVDAGSDLLLDDLLAPLGWTVFLRIYGRAAGTC